MRFLVVVVVGSCQGVTGWLRGWVFIRGVCLGCMWMGWGWVSVFYGPVVGDATGLCSRCGRSKAAAAPVEALAWVSERRGERMSWLCPVCARAHVRDIEGKLPEEYW